MSKNINSISSHAEGDSDNMTGNERPVLKRRPRVYGELMETTCFRLPKSWIDQIDESLKGSGKSRSDFIRTAIEHALSE
ncbi:Ribbon-helix-helix protein, copG family [Bifidobacterium bohemicum]|uniref:ribbon-helix-helix domain-containing protein n=1 Tax=Bifidobacterium bohemicum TaxID=638617 RepID=UPI00068A8489|nr:ribbon-helix-helix domain-containing protein [Bifidobacterium bohemicum]SCC07803.1 Ribbon-helix-helix protein, copG family [Bifidobacterium bohemicum]